MDRFLGETRVCFLVDLLFDGCSLCHVLVLGEVDAVVDLTGFCQCDFCCVGGLDDAFNVLLNVLVVRLVLLRNDFLGLLLPRAFSSASSVWSTLLTGTLLR